MSGQSDAFLAHAATGITTLCRAWAIVRKDGKTFGFTDHDTELTFDDITFRADTGLSAAALAQSTGLSVDNTEALGALTDASVREDEIEAGRFDNAEVLAWMVNWSDPDVRWLQFRGTIGELRRAGGAFHAELRGLTEALNRPLGRIYQKPCTAVLGDRSCTFDLDVPGYRYEGAADRIVNGRVFEWDDLGGFEPQWFMRGRLDVVSGAAGGLWGMIKRDVFEDGVRRIELWEAIRGEITPEDQIRLTAGCDKRFETCRLKFNNLINFQGFPDLPSDDWMMAYPTSGGSNSGGSLR
ncbi:DUF2163 domain-containing protein [Tateyamaria omphalii]|uniref:Bacteriophage phiJL001 Gp84 C-terminal domain-containing protein n=1 Tax=Tateyamaria omphalii TaxID=299262 RepID=A0A1P8MT25_9RHOB|nr:DUF2163 domain-containing protein [Tateyamaria omphalii]APX11162.1 hypothetical protein BWR18_05260 [Tateyamaria omphalii]